MNVLIRGMEMPHDCEECKLCVIIPVGDYEILRKCVVLNRRAEYVIRRKDCPLIEVLPHGRLIDASEKIKVQIYDDMTEDYHMAEMTIDDLLCQGWVEANAPTIIEAEEGET